MYPGQPAAVGGLRIVAGSLRSMYAAHKGYYMKITGEYRIAAPRQQVWEALNDSAVLKECIPGCQSLSKLSATEIEASILAQLGPVKSLFAARITLADLNPPSGYTLSGEGKSGAAGFGRGEARVTLSEVPGATLLQYTADLKLGGKLAQLGSRLLEGTTRKLADEFFTRFATRLDSAAQRTVPVVAPVGRRVPRVWLAVAALLLVALAWWLLRGH